MNHRIKALMVTVGALTLAAASATAQTNLPPVGVGPAPFLAFKDTTSSNVLSGHAYATITKTFTTTGSTSYIPCVAGTVTMQVGGAGTSLSGQLQRSDSDPAGTANPQPVGSAQSGVDPATGVAPVTATEGGYGWWNYSLTANTGTVTVSINCTLH